MMMQHLICLQCGGYCDQPFKGRCRACYQREWRARHYKPPAPVACVVCREPFNPKRRSTAQYCSSACRQAAYRGRVKVRA
jgi:hypothetical protein